MCRVWGPNPQALSWHRKDHHNNNGEIHFFLVLTLNSLAIKADSVHRRLGLGSMYSKGCLATGWDAGQTFLHKGESNGGAYPDCTVHSMQEVEPATTTKVNTCNVGTDGTCMSRENRKLRVQNLQTHPSVGGSPVEFPDWGTL